MIRTLMRIVGLSLLKMKLIRDSCVYELYKYKYKLNPKFRFNGSNILFYGDGEIIVGDSSYIGEYSTIQATSGCKVFIGRLCQISHNVRIYTSTDLADQDFSKTGRLTRFGDVIIGDFTWIGANVFINPGVSIGENSIVGANSVVTKDVLPNSIVGGVPANLIRYKSY
jgi:maltose O-acetyltransferase